MPSLEIICINQEEPIDVSHLPFEIEAEAQLISHRKPAPLFQSDFDKLNGYIYHILDGEGPTCYNLLIRDWYDEAGNSNGKDENIEFRDKFTSAVKEMLEELLAASPIGQLLFTTDYQFGPEKPQRYGQVTFAEFRQLHNLWC